MDEDIKSAKPIKYKLSCCKSYLLPRGRCYSCPEGRDGEVDL